MKEFVYKKNEIDFDILMNKIAIPVICTHLKSRYASIL